MMNTGMNHSVRLALEVLTTVSFTSMLYIVIKFLLNVDYKKFKKTLHDYQKEYDGLLEINKKIKHENVFLQKSLDKIVALYDVTKEICKSLDEASIFEYFDNQVHQYIEVRNCKFLKEDIDPQQYADCTVFPLDIGRKTIGHLICEGLKEEDKDKFLILAHQFLLGLKRAILYEKVQELAITDSLTHVLSRRYWLERFAEELERSRKFNYKLSCLMMDIDHFKKCNDHYGHMVGEIILKEVAKIIKESIRQIDPVGRYGGEEFSVFLTETGSEDAVFVAERIRKSIEDKLIRAYDEDLFVTISIGIAIFPDDAQDSQSLLGMADEALYKAKRTGRNRVCISDE